MGLKELYRLADELDKKFTAENLWCETYADYNNKICFHINWGDWKHDHLRADWVAREFFKALGYTIDITTDVTEEDGSDTYSAVHIIRFKGC